MSAEKRCVLLCGATLLSDSKLERELGRMFLVLPCHQSEKLLHVLKEKPVHVVLLEISPCGEGLEVLGQLHERYPSVPVIALGAGQSTESIARAFRYGARDFFRIPYSAQLVTERAVAVALPKRSRS